MVDVSYDGGNSLVRSDWEVMVSLNGINVFKYDIELKYIYIYILIYFDNSIIIKG